MKSKPILLSLLFIVFSLSSNAQWDYDFLPPTVLPELDEYTNILPSPSIAMSRFTIGFIIQIGDYESNP